MKYKQNYHTIVKLVFLRLHWSNVYKYQINLLVIKAGSGAFLNIYSCRRKWCSSRRSFNIHNRNICARELSLVGICRVTHSWITFQEKKQMNNKHLIKLNKKNTKIVELNNIYYTFRLLTTNSSFTFL